MPIEILMPALSPTMKEGNLANWLKKEGDNVEPGEVIAEIETDKATMEVEAVDEGIIGKILIESGAENISVNTPIALLLTEGEDKSVLESYQPSNTANNNTKTTDDNKSTNTSDSDNKASVNTGNIGADLSNSKASKTVDRLDRKFISPLAKRIAEQNNVSTDNITGSGPHGRIVKDDVLNYQPQTSPYTNPTQNIGRNPEEYKTVKNNNIRKVIARRLQESKQSIPHFYLTAECKLDKLMTMRSEINKGANVNEDGKPAFKISVNDFIIKASALALRDIPEVNSSWSDDQVLLYNNVDIAVAVAIDDGLITPIIKNADQKSITAISAEMKQLAKKARDGKLQPEEYQGGGFSISNLGMYGIKSFSAIINPPQSAILAIGSSEEKLILENGNVKAVNIMSITLSSDHRVVDGAVGAKFISKFKGYIENPYSLFI